MYAKRYRRRQKRPRRRNYRRRRVRRNRLNKIQTLTVRQPGAIIPDRLKTRLFYTNTTTSILNNGGFTVANVRYRPTNVYDVDPSLGGTTIPGFTELAGLYKYYRVHASAISLYVNNLDSNTNPLVIVLPLNDDPGTTPGVGTVQSWMTNPYARVKLLSGRGGMDKAYIKHYFSVKKIVGTNAVKYDDSYASTVTGGPQNNVYWSIGMLEQGGGSFTNGIQITVKITLYVEFYERKELLS